MAPRREGIYQPIIIIIMSKGKRSVIEAGPEAALDYMKSDDSIKDILFALKSIEEANAHVTAAIERIYGNTPDTPDKGYFDAIGDASQALEKLFGFLSFYSIAYTINTDR